MDVLTRGMKGQRALLTGAASGIGRATALMLAEAGVDLALTDQNGKGLEETAALVRAKGAQASIAQTDLGDLGAVQRMHAEFLDKFGGLEILVNCAGAVGQTALLREFDVDDWRLTHTIDLEAPVLLMKEFGAQAIERKIAGRIVNVSSSSAFHVSGRMGYSSAKAALNTASRFAARELGPHGITVNVVAPGVTKTPIFSRDPVQSAANGPLANYLKRPADPEDVAAVIVFLCTPAARQMTGQIIHTSAGAV